MIHSGTGFVENARIGSSLNSKDNTMPCRLLCAYVGGISNLQTLTARPRRPVMPTIRPCRLRMHDILQRGREEMYGHVNGPEIYEHT